MRFSIIVPIYKVEPYLVQCIDSILCQTYSDFELILVDDGSPDNCPTICDDYKKKDQRIVLLHKENGGIVSARAAGVEKAKGEYIVFVDGDDFIDITYLDAFSKIIDQYSPEVICCEAHYYYTDKTVDVLVNRMDGFYDRDRIEKEIFPSLIQEKDASHFPPSLWAKAFKKELYKQQQLSGDVRINIGEDGACTIPCVYNANSLYSLNKCMYYYRQSDSSLTKGRKPFNVDYPAVVAKHIAERTDMTSFNMKEQLDRKIVHDLFMVAVSQFYKNEKYSDICNGLDMLLLENEDYSRAIKNASFSGSIKAKMMHWALKYRWYLLLKIYSKVR